MTGFIQRNASEPDDSTPNGRIRRLVQDLWDGNQSQAARVFGISQSILSKIVRGEQAVGQRVLAAVAAHPRVNAHWLYTGEGPPLQPAEGEVPRSIISNLSPGEVGPTLPVARQLLPRPPADCPLLLTRMRMAVASPDYSPSKYWWGVTEGIPILGATSEKVASGDYLLMESDRRLWIDDPDVLNGRLMVVKLSGEHGPDLVLARGGSQPEGGYLPLDTFEGTTRVVKLALQAPAQDSLIARFGKPGRNIELDDPPPSQASPAADTPGPHSLSVGEASGPQPTSEALKSRSSEPSQEKADVVVQLDDIASICVILIRT